MEKIKKEHEIAIRFYELGMDTAIAMMREGNLRLAALPFERNKYPRQRSIRPIKATILVWKAWLRERNEN